MKTRVKIKRKILFIAVGLFLVIAFFIAWTEQQCNKKNTVIPLSGSHPALYPIPADIYPELPYKELIFSPALSLSSHAPSIIELPDGELFIAWHAPTPQGSDGAIWSSRKPLGAHGWTAPEIIYNTPGLSDKNPTLYLGQDKKLWLFWTLAKSQAKFHADTVRVKVSKDLGHTWSDAYDLGTPTGFLTRTHPLRLHDGRVILPLYVDWSASSAVVVSRDDGLTWGRPRYVLFFFGTQPTVIQRSDSSLFTLMRSGMWPRRSWQAVSNNLGRNWKGHGISGVNNPGSSLDMVKLKSGRVALVFNNSKADRFNLSLALSYDEGRTWPHIKVIENKPDSSCSYPSIIQDRHGLIHVVYSYNNQNNIAHFVTDEEWIKK